MRRMILTSLVLLPVLAQAQVSTPTEPKPSTSSAILEAELNRPASPAAASLSPSLTSIDVANHAAIREFVQTRMTDSFADAALRNGGTLTYSLMGSMPTEASAPLLIRAVEVDLSQQELSEQPAVSHVVVRATVDPYGVPRNLSVAKSAGVALDKKALAAVSQYRFKPATMDNRPVEAPVTISIKIQKP